MSRLLLSFALVIFTFISTSFYSLAYASPNSADTTKESKGTSIKNKTIVGQQNNNIQIDNKITDEEKNEYNSMVDQANQFTDDQAAALNKIPGVRVKAADLKEKKKDGVSLNPIKWIFAPVIRLQEQSVLLEQQIMKLTGPIAALQPGMLGLEHRMTSMQGQLGHLENKTASVQDELTTIHQDIKAMHATLTEIKAPVTELKGPIASLHDPILAIQKPITGVDKDLNDVKVLLGLVMASIYAAAVIIAVGTPLASILVWRNREKLLPKPDDKQQKEEDRIKHVAKTMDNQLRG